MNKSVFHFPSRNRVPVSPCVDPVVGAILSGWRYDISALSPEMRTDYEQHLSDCGVVIATSTQSIAEMMTPVTATASSEINTTEWRNGDEPERYA